MPGAGMSRSVLIVCHVVGCAPSRRTSPCCEMDSSCRRAVSAARCASRARTLSVFAESRASSSTCERGDREQGFSESVDVSQAPRREWDSSGPRSI